MSIVCIILLWDVLGDIWTRYWGRFDQSGDVLTWGHFDCKSLVHNQCILYKFKKLTKIISQEGPRNIPLICRPKIQVYMLQYTMFLGGFG